MVPHQNKSSKCRDRKCFALLGPVEKSSKIRDRKLFALLGPGKTSSKVRDRKLFALLGLVKKSSKIHDRKFFALLGPVKNRQKFADPPSQKIRPKILKKSQKNQKKTGLFIHSSDILLRCPASFCSTLCDNKQKAAASAAHLQQSRYSIASRIPP